MSDDRRRAADEDLLRVLAVVDREAADDDDDDDDDREVDAAFERLVRALPHRSPSRGFATRVMLAVRRTSVPAGREAFERAPWAVVRAGAAVVLAAALAYVAVQLALAGTPILGRILSGGVQACLWLILSAGLGLEMLAVLDSTREAMVTAVTSGQVLIGLTGAAFVSALSFAALTRLFSAQQESTRW